MAVVSDDRWTCPSCQQTTVTTQRHPVNVRRELRLEQLRHSKRHQRELAQPQAARR